MKKNILKMTLVALGLFIFSTPAFASKLPDDVWKYIKASIPKAQQRFDSVITISDDLMYIPLYPPSEKTVEKIEIEYAYPQKPLSQYPEVVLLNNGYSLLKVFKDAQGNYTLTKKDDLPIKVRLGLMPQDMLTPIGLKMPESLKLTLGDLLIPSKDESSLAMKEEKEKEKNSYSPAVKRNEFIPTVEFTGKKTFLNTRNSKFLSVYDETNQTPLYELKLSSMPLKIITSEKSKVALVLYWSGREIEIINLNDETTLAKIQMDANASDVVLNKKENIAYVASQNANAIYVVDLNSMQLKKIVKVDQKPSKITYCELDDTISFYDEYASKIFNVTRNQEGSYIVQPIGEAKNISRILSDVANIYAISRTQNELYIFDKVQAKLSSSVEVDNKPTDAILWGTKLFILCSKEGYLDVYDTTQGKLISREQISKEGFYSKMTLMPDKNNLLITGINSKSYLLYSLEEMKVVKKQESYIDVANIIILDKVQRL